MEKHCMRLRSHFLVGKERSMSSVAEEMDGDPPSDGGAEEKALTKERRLPRSTKKMWPSKRKKMPLQRNDKKGSCATQLMVRIRRRKQNNLWRRWKWRS